MRFMKVTMLKRSNNIIFNEKNKKSNKKSVENESNSCKVIKFET